jgi:hypothetical protein
VRFHDLHGDGRFSLIEFAREREIRAARREKRRKARAMRSPRRWISIGLAVVRWHLASPDWSPRGRREALSPLAPAYGLPYDPDLPGAYENLWPVEEVEALEALTLARLAALRDGRRTLARVLLDVHLIAVAGREDEVVHLLELMATGTRAQLPCQGERVH